MVLYLYLFEEVLEMRNKGKNGTDNLLPENDSYSGLKITQDQRDRFKKENIPNLIKRRRVEWNNSKRYIYINDKTDTQPDMQEGKNILFYNQSSANQKEKVSVVLIQSILDLELKFDSINKWK